MKTIERTKYLNRIIDLNGTPDIKLITGVYHSGKSLLQNPILGTLKHNLRISISFL